MIKEIIEREWDFFQKVNNIGGRASCQDDYETFSIQRGAQFEVFYDDVRESYLEDLKLYKEIGRNPLMEKYARMMESSDPEYFETIKEYLPPMEQMQKDLIETIVDIEVGMREEFNQQYPHISSLARLTYSSQDNQEDTSFETYLRGELSTYSPHTLYLYGQMILDMVQKQENMIMMIMEKTAKAYGYKSLEDADSK